ncbi:MAG: hypothetical protein OXI22_06555 [Defluviicoccus sp.]|nr:hypothetical protein [Defluviicoccus sp.]MDE0383528.1 hypothetical protein [Defluviicoccus sp.]
MSEPTVFVFANADLEGRSNRRMEEAGCRLTFGDEAWHVPGCVYEDDMAARAAEAVAMTGTSIRSAPVNRRIIEGALRLRIIAKCTVGTDDIDVDAATDLGVLVTHAPTQANWGGVAEGAMAMILTMLKRNREKDAHVKAGGWKHESLIGTYLGRRDEDGYAGLSVGIVGFGRIGGRMVELLKPWHVRLLVCDPFVDDAKFAEYGVERVDLDTLLADSDIVSLHPTLNPTSRRMMGAAQFRAMKQSALFVNTSRGGTMDEVALADAIAAGEIAGAALDVFLDEPMDRNSKLLDMGNEVLLSPHMISHNHGGGLGPGIQWAANAVLAALRGEVPDNVFNPDVLPRWRERFAGNALIA